VILILPQWPARSLRPFSFTAAWPSRVLGLFYHLLFSVRDQPRWSARAHPIQHYACSFDRPPPALGAPCRDLLAFFHILLPFSASLLSLARSVVCACSLLLFPFPLRIRPGSASRTSSLSSNSSFTIHPETEPRGPQRLPLTQFLAIFLLFVHFLLGITENTFF